jgi:hypothetical protein
VQKGMRERERRREFIVKFIFGSMEEAKMERF